MATEGPSSNASTYRPATGIPLTVKILAGTLLALAVVLAVSRLKAEEVKHLVLDGTLKWASSGVEKTASDAAAYGPGVWVVDVLRNAVLGVDPEGELSKGPELRYEVSGQLKSLDFPRQIREHGDGYMVLAVEPLKNMRGARQVLVAYGPWLEEVGSFVPKPAELYTIIDYLPTSHGVFFFGSAKMDGEKSPVWGLFLLDEGEVRGPYYRLEGENRREIYMNYTRDDTSRFLAKIRDASGGDAVYMLIRNTTPEICKVDLQMERCDYLPVPAAVRFHPLIAKSAAWKAAARQPDTQTRIYYEALETSVDFARGLHAGEVRGEEALFVLAKSQAPNAVVPSWQLLRIAPQSGELLGEYHLSDAAHVVLARGRASNWYVLEKDNVVGEAELDGAASLVSSRMTVLAAK